MTKTKLIIVEGIPGSGKTTTAEFIKKLLDKEGIDNELYSEGNLEHPADFEAVACLSKAEYELLLLKYERFKPILESSVIKKDNNIFIHYGKIKNERGNELSEDLYNEIIKFDVCDGLSLERYHELTLKRWNEFAERASKEDKVYIFECCFIQNPLVVMMARHCTAKEYIMSHVLQIENIINKLNPKLIYYYQESVRETIKRVAEIRDKGWINFVIEYICNQAYGEKHDLNGFDGTVKFFEDRRSVELELLEKLSIDKLILDNSGYNWENCYNKIEKFLGNEL
ncbi:hypothetical protein JK636_16975 [Clostridium sp. YIM B02515]|uniref:Thymidylate kinase n=1 Tax=Clostridium rhizosphaerae TaxID=2803861 RepID=A0ABS1TFM3_9CLOT|nr:hypothetical protein [Clostridium rhizosphaerae]MBL4937416.1 hypothetical protein [Clostridium rhizosphaerae]